MDDNTSVQRLEGLSRDTNSGGERDREKHQGDSVPWLGGAVLILVGMALLLRNFTGFSLDNWWALFIMIPAMGSYAAARRDYRNHGWSASVRGSLIGGTILLFVTLVFLFNLSWGTLWPVILIILGAGALLTAVMR